MGVRQVKKVKEELNENKKNIKEEGKAGEIKRNYELKESEFIKEVKKKKIEQFAIK